MTEPTRPASIDTELTQRARSHLDVALQALGDGRVDEPLDALVDALARMRRASSAQSWAAVVDECRGHELRESLHRDPFTLRCYSKPRGYAADAVALDYVLRARPASPRGRDLAGDLHHYTTHGGTAEALRFRRDYVAREIDATAAQSRRPARVFAAGCGHLRECDPLASIRDGRIAKIVAFDADAESLDTVRRDYPQFPIVTHRGSIRELAEGRHLFGDMDLVYTAGVMETLPHAAAVGLARALFALLAPGGTLLITHFLPSLGEAGFIEAFMDWWMVYRTQAQVFDLVKELPPDTASSWAYSESAASSLGVVSIRRR
jgi:extracellular factor (EF) 3-hydroxypalmitic acid methyl ester biosynthesis protein